jgi:L-rhamnose mutarotase
MRKRVMYLQKIKSGCVKEYLAYHRRVWPALEAAYRQAGFTDLSCFVRGRQLVVYIEWDEAIHRRKKAWLKKHPVERRWQELMDGLKDSSFGSLELKEVYRFPPRAARKRRRQSR